MGSWGRERFYLFEVLLLLPVSADDLVAILLEPHAQVRLRSQPGDAEATHQHSCAACPRWHGERRLEDPIAAALGRSRGVALLLRRRATAACSRASGRHVGLQNNTGQRSIAATALDASNEFGSKRHPAG